MLLRSRRSSARHFGRNAHACEFGFEFAKVPWDTKRGEPDQPHRMPITRSMLTIIHLMQQMRADPQTLGEGKIGAKPKATPLLGTRLSYITRRLAKPIKRTVATISSNNGDP